MQYIPHHFDQGGDIDIVSLQNMANNDQYLYDEVVRRPRGILAYAEMYGSADSETQNIHGWKDIKDNSNTDSLRVRADIEDNRIIRVEVYIPHIQIRGPISGDPITYATSWAGVRVVRDESQLGRPVGARYWPMPFDSGFPNSVTNRDRRSLYLMEYDFPDAGRHSYGAQWKNHNMGDPSGGALHIRNEDGYNDPPDPVTDYLANWAIRLPPCQLIITDMGSTEGLDVPPGFSDKRNRDKIASVDTTDIVHNVRRARGGKGKRHGF